MSVESATRPYLQELVIGVKVNRDLQSPAKNPLNAYSLMASDLVVGRRIICFNANFGVQSVGVVSKVVDNQLYLQLDDGRTRIYRLDVVGVMHDHGTWSRVCFVVDEADRDKLPSVVPTQRRFGIDAFSDDPDHQHYYGELI